MTVLMVRMGDGFYIPKLDGFDDIKKDTVTVNINLVEDESKQLSYKELKGIATMERYYEKLENQISTENYPTAKQKEFRKKYHLTKSLEDYLKEQL